MVDQSGHLIVVIDGDLVVCEGVYVENFSLNEDTSSFVGASAHSHSSFTFFHFENSDIAGVDEVGRDTFCVGFCVVGCDTGVAVRVAGWLAELANRAFSASFACVYSVAFLCASSRFHAAMSDFISSFTRSKVKRCHYLWWLRVSSLFRLFSIA